MELIALAVVFLVVVLVVFVLEWWEKMKIIEEYNHLKREYDNTIDLCRELQLQLDASQDALIPRLYHDSKQPDDGTACSIGNN